MSNNGELNMNKIYRDDIIKFNQFDLRKDGDVFQTILDERKKEFDSQRFFLQYLPQNFVNEYDFNDLKSLKKFRDDCLSDNIPLRFMGGCNLEKEKLQKGIRYAGKKISDPSGKILGTFNIEEEKIIYSPIFPFFYDERDNIKFANDIYFTTITFEEIVKNQIDLAKEFYIHTGNYTSTKDIMRNGYNPYIYEKISKDQMLEFVCKPELGGKIFTKNLKS